MKGLGWLMLPIVAVVAMLMMFSVAAIADDSAAYLQNDLAIADSTSAVTATAIAVDSAKSPASSPAPVPVVLDPGSCRVRFAAVCGQLSKDNLTCGSCKAGTWPRGRLLWMVFRPMRE